MDSATSALQPLWREDHVPTGNAIFSLAFGYDVRMYERFVGSLRKVGYSGDIVLAVSPMEDMKRGVAEYLRKHRVIAYPFHYTCKKKHFCRFSKWDGDKGDTRPWRPVALMRYQLYAEWLKYYTAPANIFICDFRDLFFQSDPFASLAGGAEYDLYLFEENHSVKSIGTCPFNRPWIAKCWGEEVMQEWAQKPVICSGSTLGTYDGTRHYVSRMIKEFDDMNCFHKKPSAGPTDQGYHNYLYYSGQLGKVKVYPQGHGPVNTIGAMNGRRVPADKKGPLGAFWKARDKEGYVINWDGTRSPVVHQWDRFHDELVEWVDSHVF
jgi:hypothetical protein